ncbi:hypothetical protein O2K51_11095 [Apibacter raozihei]|uniref:hypothetical protein n=1 Tax=Apibacter raozihei TaxID=2500547 RepID=UPI000FE2EEFD|nr:hypothetical protein [Apibacter raozihei]
MEKTNIILFLIFFIFLSCFEDKNVKLEDKITKNQLRISGVINPEKYDMLLGDWVLAKIIINKKFEKTFTMVKDTAINIHISKEGVFSDKGVKLGESDKKCSMAFNLVLDTLEGKYFVKANLRKPDFFVLQNPGISYMRNDSIIGYIKTQLFFIRKE